MACVQFNHRNLAYLTYTVSSVLFWTGYFNPAVPKQVKLALLLSYILVNYQLANGVNMLLNGVPLRMGLEHQVNFQNFKIKINFFRQMEY
jgi:heme A synthase